MCGTSKSEKDLTDEQREQVREGLRRERKMFSSALPVASLTDWMAKHSPSDAVNQIAMMEESLAIATNAHRWLEDRLHHAVRERNNFERDLVEAEKKLTAATLDNVRLEKERAEYRQLYLDLKKHHEQDHRQIAERALKKPAPMMVKKG